MIDEAAAANRLFGGSMNPAETPAPQPKPQGKTAAERQQQQPEQQAKPAQDAKAGDQQQQQLDPEVAQAAAEITSTLGEIGIDPAHADTASFSKLAAELSLTPQGAQRLAEWDQQRSQNAWDQASNNWHAEARTDPLYSDNVSAGHALLSEFADDRLMDEVIELGFGNHPAVIGFMGRVGRALEQARRNRR